MSLMQQAAVMLSASLWLIGVFVFLVSLVARRGAEDQLAEHPWYSRAALVDWASGWMLMLALALLGASANALWFNFPNSVSAVVFLFVSFAWIFIGPALFWTLLKMYTIRANRRRSGQ